MATPLERVLVSGGAGFIGSAVIRRLFRDTDALIVNLDKLTYAGDLDSVADVARSERYAFEHLDICDRPGVERVFREFQPTAVMHLAAETHVDRSIDGPAEFIRTNVVGTAVLLEAARAFYASLDTARKDAFRFHHVSTDEVYGSLGEAGKFREDSPYQPNSPYAASKAAADHLVRSWHHTYGVPAIVTNCSNNYGPYQFPEKLIPLAIARALGGQTIPVYGQGTNVRDWLYVDDHAEALITVVERGRPGETYNVGGGAESTNIALVHHLCDLLDESAPCSRGSYRQQIAFVADRPAHDLRYAIDHSKITAELGWLPRNSLESGLAATVQWYLGHRHWIDRIRARKYDGRRLGLAR